MDDIPVYFLLCVSYTAFLCITTIDRDPMYDFLHQFIFPDYLLQGYVIYSSVNFREEEIIRRFLRANIYIAVMLLSLQVTPVVTPMVTLPLEIVGVADSIITKVYYYLLCIPLLNYTLPMEMEMQIFVTILIASALLGHKATPKILLAQYINILCRPIEKN
jgi:hypothetical protein